jgi:hypothetical protein
MPSSFLLYNKCKIYVLLNTELNSGIRKSMNEERRRRLKKQNSKEQNKNTYYNMIGYIFEQNVKLNVSIYIEMSQGNCLCSYLKQTKMSFFFFYKTREQKGQIYSV